MSQQAAWEQEYTDAKGVPTSTRTKPSSAVIHLLDYLHKKKLQPGHNAIDIGCGAGRNSLYLAQNGFNVMAIDFAQSALGRLRRAAEGAHQEGKIQTKQCDLTRPLPFDDNLFDLAVDIVSTISLMPEEMISLEVELSRIVKPNGIFLTYVHSRDDGYLQAAAPGEISYTVDGLTDYTWTEDELRKLYKKWRILALEKTEKVDGFFGKQYTRRIWWLLLQNTNNVF